MSLDITLEKITEPRQCTCSCCGHTHISRIPEHVWERNITSNLAGMFKALGIDDVIWEPQLQGIKKAMQMIKPLESALAKIEANPQDYAQYNASNGWGKVEHMIEFLKDYIAACKEYPKSIVSTNY